MALSDDLKSLFPKYSFDYSRGSVTICETDANAKVNEITWINSDFHFIDTSIVKDMSSFFRIATSPKIFNLDCDGMIVFEANGKKYFFLSELKSSFDTCDLYHAMHQIISSYIKVNMLLHLLVGYKNSDYEFKAFIACLSPNGSYIRDLYKQLMMPSGSKYKTEADFASELYVDKKVDIKAIECEKLRGLNLGSNCLFTKLSFNYIEVPQGYNSATVDVTNYI